MARLTFRAPAPLARFIAPKGSVALDGVSLTVNEVDGDTFAVLIIPHTLRVTTLGALRAGDRVNLEVDQMARYAARLMEAMSAAESAHRLLLRMAAIVALRYVQRLRFADRHCGVGSTLAMACDARERRLTMAGPRRAASTDEGALDGARILVVEARYYEDIADALLAGAKRALDGGAGRPTTSSRCRARWKSRRRSSSRSMRRRGARRPMTAWSRSAA